MSACTCPTCHQPVEPTDLLIDMERRIIVRMGQRAEPTAQELAVFLALHDRHPGTATREDIAAAIDSAANARGRSAIANKRERRALARKRTDVVICRLRAALIPLCIAITTHQGSGHGLVLTSSPEEAKRINDGFRGRPRIAPDATDAMVVRLLAVRGLAPVEICERTRLDLAAVNAALAGASKPSEVAA